MKARHRTCSVVVALMGAALVAALTAFPAEAAFPGSNGKVAFVRANDIWTMNPDGTNQVNLTNSAAVERSPAWSPDGQKIAFVSPFPGDVYVMNADGTGRTPLSTGFTNTASWEVGWSPDGQKIAAGACCPPAHDSVLITMNATGGGGTVIADSLKGIDWPDWSPNGTRIAYTMFDDCADEGDLLAIDPNGANRAYLSGMPSCSEETDDQASSWAPDASRIAFASAPCFGTCSHSIWTMGPTGGTQQQLTSGHEDFGPAWSPDGTKIAFVRDDRIQVMKADGTSIADITDGADPDWQPIPLGYPRPKGATPMRIALVTANDACTSPNRTHGAPLAFPSCAPPQLTSDQLTVGTGDSNAKPAMMQASIRFDVTAGDVTVKADLNDIFTKDLSDYTGGLRASIPVQITDKSNGFPAAPWGTVQGFPLEFDIGCTATADPNAGSDCALNTTLDTLVPGSVTAGKRAMWALGQAKVYDGGTDGNPTTTGDNTLFAVEGVFIP